MKNLSKKLIFLICTLALFCAFSLSGCGESDETPAGDAPGFGKSDLYLVIGGTKYYCDRDINDIISTFGEDYEYSEAISCAYDGLDKTYGYGDFEVLTYPDGDKDYVQEIYVFGGSAQTSKGIKLGDSKDDVTELYGEGNDTGYLLTYELPASNEKSEGASLYFTFDGDRVSAMAITAEQPIE
ncbi:MAG: hypothetical protein LBL09_04120 [Oscillospiraceae bacterium]|jgi:hypothetical protein|nr:hypothetical protein [Oscillospiraceae bacterium]